MFSIPEGTQVILVLFLFSSHHISSIPISKRRSNVNALQPEDSIVRAEKHMSRHSTSLSVEDNGLIKKFSPVQDSGISPSSVRHESVLASVGQQVDDKMDLEDRHGEMKTNLLGQNTEDVSPEAVAQLYHQYLSDRSTCKWTNSSFKHAGNPSYLEYATESDWYHGQHVEKAGEDLFISTCTSGSAHEQAGLSVFRLGPFTTYGESYHTFLFTKPMMDIITLNGEKDQSFFLQGTFIAPTDEHGEPFGLPPIHNHHAHVGFVGDGWPVMFARTGDDAPCQETLGGKTCYYIPMSSTLKNPFFPQMIENQTMYVDGVFNDVRRKSSERIQFWVEVGFRLASSTSASSVSAGPSPIMASAPFFYIYGPGLWSDIKDGSMGEIWTGEYPLITRHDSLVFYSVVVNESGYLSHFSLHRHGVSNLKEISIFKGTEKQLGLHELAGLTELMPWEPYVPELFGSDMHRLRQHVQQFSERNNVQHVCNASSNLEENMEFVRSFMSSVKSGYYDRAYPVKCQPIHATKGTVLTFLWFHESRLKDKIPYGYWEGDSTPKFIHQHSNFRGFFKPDEGGRNPFMSENSHFYHAGRSGTLAGPINRNHPCFRLGKRQPLVSTSISEATDNLEAWLDHKKLAERNISLWGFPSRFVDDNCRKLFTVIP